MHSIELNLNWELNYLLGGLYNRLYSSSSSSIIYSILFLPFPTRILYQLFVIGNGWTRFATQIESMMRNIIIVAVPHYHTGGFGPHTCNIGPCDTMIGTWLIEMAGKQGIILMVETII